MMQETIQQGKMGNGADVLIKPPRLFLISIVAGLLFQLLWPFKFASSGAVVWLGLSLISGSLGLMFWADGTFKRWETAVNPDNPATTLVKTGPYRFSRNPMYLAFLLIQFGIGLVVGSWWLFITLLPTWIMLRWGIIAREEWYLAEAFGTTYHEYKTAVRRWL
jgi:protein-S-isoprenylcysteine O-methyltransferase Ste14